MPTVLNDSRAVVRRWSVDLSPDTHSVAVVRRNASSSIRSTLADASGATCLVHESVDGVRDSGLKDGQTLTLGNVSDERRDRRSRALRERGATSSAVGSRRGVAWLGGSVCGRTLSGKPASTIGFERRFNRAFATEDREAFVRLMLEDIPARP